MLARERKFSTEELFQQTKSILLEVGYEGFTFSLLAEQLDVSRGTIYKYYENKDELITDFMLYEINLYLTDLKGIEKYNDFGEQFNFLLDLILRNPSIQQLIEIGLRVPSDSNEKVAINMKQLKASHMRMYQFLQDFVYLGKKEGILKPQIPDALILGYIFQSVAIPNHFGVPHQLWIQSIKEVIRDGMFVHN